MWNSLKYNLHAAAMLLGGLGLCLLAGALFILIFYQFYLPELQIKADVAKTTGCRWDKDMWDFTQRPISGSGVLIAPDHGK